jgi:hypothetical protein
MVTKDPLSSTISKSQVLKNLFLPINLSQIKISNKIHNMAMLYLSKKFSLRTSRSTKARISQLLQIMLSKLMEFLTIKSFRVKFKNPEKQSQ